MGDIKNETELMSVMQVDTYSLHHFALSIHVTNVMGLLTSRLLLATCNTPIDC